MKKVLIATLFATLALYGCSEDTTEDNGDGGSGGSAGDSGTGGGGGMGTGGGGGDGGGGAGGDAGPAWETFSASLSLSGLEGQILQVGFINTAGNFEGSGVFYDNVVIELEGAGGAGGAGEILVEDDFESADLSDPDIGDGWFFFVNVFDGSGNRKFGYVEPPIAAPNGTDNISGIVDDQGGAEQGTRQLNVFSDYTCCDLGEPPANQQGHGPTNEAGVPDSTDRVEVSVFQEPFNFDNRITADAATKTVVFTFDAKLGNAEGATTAGAFIKTLDPDAGFTVTNNIPVNLFP